MNQTAHEINRRRFEASVPEPPKRPSRAQEYRAMSWSGWGFAALMLVLLVGGAIPAVIAGVIFGVTCLLMVGLGVMVLVAKPDVRAPEPKRIASPEQAWKLLSNFVGVTQERSVDSCVTVAKRLAQEFPQGLNHGDKLMIDALEKAGMGRIAGAYFEIARGEIVDPAFRPQGTHESFPGEEEALAQDEGEALRSLATIAGKPSLRDPQLIVEELIQKFPDGLAPATVITAAQARVLLRLNDGYEKSRRGLRNPVAEKQPSSSEKTVRQLGEPIRAGYEARAAARTASQDQRLSPELTM